MSLKSYSKLVFCCYSGLDCTDRQTHINSVEKAAIVTEPLCYHCLFLLNLLYQYL